MTLLPLCNLPLQPVQSTRMERLTSPPAVEYTEPCNQRRRRKNGQCSPVDHASSHGVPSPGRAAGHLLGGIEDETSATKGTPMPTRSFRGLYNEHKNS